MGAEMDNRQTARQATSPTVTELSPEQLANLERKWTADLGEQSFSKYLNERLERIRKGTQPFLICWQGDKTPRGAVILGTEISGTQHGIVSDADGKTLGTYERLVEFGGQGKNEHMMIVYANSRKVE